jgi:hypothetical protein
MRLIERTSREGVRNGAMKNRMRLSRVGSRRGPNTFTTGRRISQRRVNTVRTTHAIPAIVLPALHNESQFGTGALAGKMDAELLDCGIVVLAECCIITCVFAGFAAAASIPTLCAAATGTGAALLCGCANEWGAKKQPSTATINRKPARGRHDDVLRNALHTCSCTEGLLGFHHDAERWDTSACGRRAPPH